MRILVVEDERKVASFIRQGLQEEGHAVDIAPDGGVALDLALGEGAYDLVILDVLLPLRDGFEILRAMRAHRVTTPVLMLTARDTVAERVAGLDAGADDYLVKPFAFEELIARVRALLRRSGEQGSATLRIGDLSLDPHRREATRGERRLALTTREYALLEYFMQNPGRVLTRPMLAEHVWGLDFDPESNIVDVYVGYLRRKIDTPSDARLLHTVRGAGYVMKLET
jgi:DNA-binding response OmpR family regulator